MFIKNTWYVAGWSDDFGQSLSALTILDEAVVIYRTPDGHPVALEDACPHRKLPLSKGKLCGKDIECGYHGLTFGPDGQCVKAPTQPDSIPIRAVVHSYPVEDRYGILWIWMGDSALANTDDIFYIDNYDNPEWGRTRGGTIDIACNYLYITDNLLDPFHVAWVHVGSFAGAGTEAQSPELDILEDGVLVWRWMPNQPPPPYYADLLSFSGHCDRKQHYECRLPSIAINKSIFAPAGTGGPNVELPVNTFINISYNFMTPVDENNSRYFWFQHRNSDPDNAALSERMFEGAKNAFLEDKDVLVHVHDGMKNPRSRNIALHLDGGANRFRLQVGERIKAEQSAQAKSD